MRSERLIGLPVIHIDLGKRCGVVQGLILDPAKRRVAGLVVSLAGWRTKGLLPIERVYATGEQAVTIDDESAILNANDDTELRTLWRRRLDLRGMQVLTVTGRGLGSVAAYEFGSDGEIETIHLQRNAKGLRAKRGRTSLPGSLVRSFGEDAVIVAGEAEAWLDAEPEPSPPEGVKAYLTAQTERTVKPEGQSSVADRLLSRLSGLTRRSEREAKGDDGTSSETSESGSPSRDV